MYCAKYTENKTKIIRNRNMIDRNADGEPVFGSSDTKVQLEISIFEEFAKQISVGSTSISVSRNLFKYTSQFDLKREENRIPRGLPL